MIEEKQYATYTIGVFASCRDSKESLMEIGRLLRQHNVRLLSMTENAMQFFEDGYTEPLNGQTTDCMLYKCAIPNERDTGKSIDQFFWDNDSKIDGVLLICDSPDYYPVLNAVANIGYSGNFIMIALEKANIVANTYLDHKRT